MANRIEQARSALTEAEGTIRELIQAAALEGDYAEVGELVRLAQNLKNLVPTDGASTVLVRAPASTRVPTRSRASPDAYPRFARENDRLVKIGWSKRERREYEHKAPRAAALAVYLKLGNAKKAFGGPFRMDEVLPANAPATTPDGSDVPAYQAYVVLAWLRSAGQIEKSGNDSYEWTLDEITEDTFDEAWNSLPEQEERK